MKDLLVERSPVFIAVVIFLICAGVLYYMKPKLMFTSDGEFREFGFDMGRTVFTYPVVLCIIALFIYLITFIGVSFYNNNGNM